MARAQEPADGQPSILIQQVDAQGFPAITAVVTVLDARGLPVVGLAPEAFSAESGGEAAAVASAASAQDASLGLSVVLAIDTSGSMAAALPDAQAAARAFVEKLGPNDRVAIVTFGEAVTPLVGFTSDRVALNTGIDGLTAVGDTTLYEAVQTSAYIANSSDTPRTAVVLLTDGQNDTQISTVTADEALASADLSTVPFYTIGFGSAPDEGFLRGLAERTRGEYRPASSGDVALVYENLAGVLRSQYVLTIDAPGEADGAESSLRVNARVGELVASASAGFTRGTAPPVVVPTVVIEPIDPPVAAEPASSGGLSVAAIVVGVVVGAAILAVVAMVVLRMLKARRVRRAQLDVVAPNPELARAQGVPSLAGAPLADGGRLGRLTVRGVEPRYFEITATPLTIGSDPASSVVLEASANVAYRHALVWMRGERIMLRHVGGAMKKTVVGGKAIDWVALDDGDEIAIGPHVLQAQHVSEAAPTMGAARVQGEPGGA